jgi:hypothetical protein
VRFLKANPSSSIKWTKRDNNRVAHELAKWAETQPNSNWINSVPSCILPYIHKDMGFVISALVSIKGFASFQKKIIVTWSQFSNKEFKLILFNNQSI